MAVIIKPLTAQQINNAKPEESPLRDGEGLILFITNTSKKWRLDYKRPITKSRTSITLGDYPDISLKEARQLRQFYRGLLADGIDPKKYLREKEAEKADRIENSFYKIAVKWKAFKSQKVKEETMFDEWRRLDKHIFPKLGALPIKDINSRLLVEVLQPVYRKGHTSVIEKTLRSIEGIMDYAENTGLISE
ncbi:integrase arm-type DNA-binding domain-containing protein [Actinobacillus capsulatus]|uniref:integrase arm-type DNA-binding domain-containing protein n=1 Tax=Actinobacillus capsulatus TaxID=717 RepID=UPI000382A8FA|nr:integrase arm-type DNA-binding domain-containing protein [Actinobacillus capsulatus]